MRPERSGSEMLAADPAIRHCWTRAAIAAPATSVASAAERDGIAAGTFELVGTGAYLSYRVERVAAGEPVFCDGGVRFTGEREVLDILHTYTPIAQRGRGLAQRLVAAAFHTARGRLSLSRSAVTRGRSPAPASAGVLEPMGSMKIRPSCTYVSDTFLRRPRNAEFLGHVEHAFTEPGLRAQARRRRLRAMKPEELAALAATAGGQQRWRKPVLIEWLIKHEFGADHCR